MAVSGYIEWKLEAAFVAVLAARLDLAGVRVCRANDATEPGADDMYPAIAVLARGAQDEDWSALADYQRVYMDCECKTYSREDTTGSGLRDLVGGVRDAVRATGFTARLTGAVPGLTVHGAVIDEPTYDGDGEDRVRSRTVTVTVHASARDIG